MKKIVLAFLFVITSFSLFAQKEDYIWLTGYSSNTIDSTFGGTRIDFNTEPPTVSYEFREMDFFLASASICDTAGNLLFYTDATTVMNSNNQIIENGEELGLNPYHRSRALMGLGVPQVSLIFRYPGSDSNYIIIHEELSDEEIGDAGTSIPNCYYSILNKNSTLENFSVIGKNINIISDTLTYGKMTATRHANGRDWWILIGEYDTNNYYTVLLTNNGIEEIFQQSLGDIPVIGLAGQSVFFPDGSKYAHKGAFYFTEPGSIDIYNFDRCTGLLSNSLHIPIDTTEEGFIDGGLGGLAFSPNSELLYHSRDVRLEQYNLLADDIPGSVDTIASYDGFQDPITNVPTNYGLAQLAPNDKIYVATTGNTRYMHIIHNPNERGPACNVEQHGLQLATFNDWSVPNHPNYRLKALIGSPCDTIRPIAAFITTVSVIPYLRMSLNEYQQSGIGPLAMAAAAICKTPNTRTPKAAPTKSA